MASAGIKTLNTKEQNVATGVQCPYCSKFYELKMLIDIDRIVGIDYENSEVPDKCRRCNCPMDQTAFLKFSDQRAEEEAKRYGPLARPAVTA